MADLIDRIQGTDATRPKLPMHQFAAALAEYARGRLTRAQLATAFDLQGSEATQATALADAMDAKSGTTNKMLYSQEIADVAYFAEQPELGIYATKAAIKTRLEL